VDYIITTFTSTTSLSLYVYTRFFFYDSFPTRLHFPIKTTHYKTIYIQQSYVYINYQITIWLYTHIHTRSKSSLSFTTQQISFLSLIVLHYFLSFTLTLSSRLSSFSPILLVLNDLSQLCQLVLNDHLCDLTFYKSHKALLQSSTSNRASSECVLYNVSYFQALLLRFSLLLFIS